ncbi:MAG: PIN domain-containing protein [Armatimonadota bacterium]|nr:PIN domain-containing protein [bacterium]MDW8321821.1 PIN domain-containing protein [Armatimonadota bacterium]
MRRRIFVDTSAWIALVDESDRHHQKAKSYYEQHIKQRGVELITSDYVIDETLTVIRYRMGLTYARRFWHSIEQAPDQNILKMFRIEETTWSAALAMFFQYDDQDFSFTDCTSFALLCQEPVDAVFSFDKDFVVAGFLMEP